MRRPWLYDGNAFTCEQNQELKQLEVILPFQFPFTWLRLQVSDPSLLHGFQVKFINRRNETTLACNNMRNATVDDQTLDIHCDLDVLVKGVFLTGDGVKSLCSVYISGHRNVALLQNATQSNTYSNTTAGHTIDASVATNAVDGNRASDFNEKSCSHTDLEDKNSHWTVTLSSPYTINRYVLYNRPSNAEQLIRFTLTSFTKDRKTVFNYMDPELP
jgi:hypothetical protein